MQPKFIEVPKREKTSLLFREMTVSYFYNPYHFHPEYELTFIMKGWGTRYIGDHIDKFSEGDLVLVGPNLPHMWKNDKIFYAGEKEFSSRAIIIQFRELFAGEELWQLPEMKKVRNLLDLARQGLQVKGNAKQKVVHLMMQMVHRTNAERIADLILILCTIADSDSRDVLSSIEYSKSHIGRDGDRLNKVYTHVVNHFEQSISLEEVASIANMAPTAFCRYFKSRTNKTFSKFLIETRINYACKMLANGNRNISDVAYEAGFNSVSYFTRQFKNLKGIPPLLYRKEFRETS